MSRAGRSVRKGTSQTHPGRRQSPISPTESENSFPASPSFKTYAPPMQRILRSCGMPGRMTGNSFSRSAPA